jgi:hypothetical protein
MQFDAKTGKRQDPPIETKTPISPNPEQLAEEAQMEIVGK